MELHRRAFSDLPCHPRPGGPLSHPASTGVKAEISDARAIRLLFVEHDSSFARYVKGLLGTQNAPPLEIEWTRWLDAAVERIQSGSADAVILDISLPDISGIEIFRTIHRAGPHIPILIMADFDDETMACHLIREGAQDFLPKDALDPLNLCRSVRFAVARSRTTRKRGKLTAYKLSKDSPYLPDEELSHDLSQPPGSPSRALRMSKETIKILLLEHSDKDYWKFQSCMGGEKEIRMTRAKSIQSAFRLLSRHDFDLVCLDYLLPDGTGHDFLTKMKHSGLDIPVVVITAHRDPMIAAQIIQAGAYDYLPKQKLSRGPLLRIIMNSLEKARLRKQVQEARKKIIEISILDDLTGLYNRRYFMQVLEKEIGRAARYGNPLSLCMMDLDGFKKINDTYGHQAGDMVLREFGKMLRQSVRLSDTACRYGGEEFALLLPNTASGEARALGERLRCMMESHLFAWKGRFFRVTLSLGLTPPGGETPTSCERSLELADMALYEAKRGGRNRVVSYGGTRMSSKEREAAAA